MPSNSKKLSQFWQELKRRKVSRVITVYAAAAFVILELVDIIADPLKLPEWFLTAVIVFLCIGFIIAVILSWIYDVRPEGGIVKTEPTDKVKAEEIPKSSNSWKIASYISFIVIVGLIVLNIIPRANNKMEILDKSIAVLPLEYLSEDPNKQYLANGVLDAITGHLSMIEGLRVMPRTSVEQYRENKKTAKQIGEELGVSYLIEGSFLMIGDQVKLTIQLVVANAGDHVFFKEYDRNYEEIIIVQSEVAKTIAKEIEIAITPEEQALIEKVPTTSLTAYDFYQRGREEHLKVNLVNPIYDNTEALQRAEFFYRRALEYDQTYALAYVGLGNVYRMKNERREYFSDSFLDSSLVLANMALTYDDQLAEAIVLRGEYYLANGQPEKALEEFDKAISLNANQWEAYYGKAKVFSNDDIVQALYNAYTSASLNRGPFLANIFKEISGYYVMTGYREKAIYYSKEALNLDDDSVSYYVLLSGIEYEDGEYDKALEFGIKAFNLDSNDGAVLNNLANIYMDNKQFEESLKYRKQEIARMNFIGKINLGNMHRTGYAYWINGFEDEAMYYFNKQFENCTQAIELGRRYATQLYHYYDLAAVYAFRGETDKALENLRIFNQRKIEGLWMLSLINRDPLFDSIRDEPEFQQIVRDVEAKYQAEHERVGKWLEENDML